MTSNSDHISSDVNVKTYIIGTVLSVVMTIAPFLMVNNHISKIVTFWVILISAVIQILTHLICFLHLNTASNAGWNLISFLFTIIIVSILLIGSVWIMWNLNQNMMVC